MRQTVKVTGFILKKKILLNHDLVISIFTQELGLISVFAKGVRKITSRRLPHIETANLVTALLSKKQDYYYLGETKLISGLSEIKKDQIKLKCLYVFIFVLDKILPPLQKEEGIFQLFKLFLIGLTKSEDSRSVLIKYLNKLVISLGYLEKDKGEKEIIDFIEDLIDEKIPSFDI